jgi:hypothetical protein
MNRARPYVILINAVPLPKFGDVFFAGYVATVGLLSQ